MEQLELGYEVEPSVEPEVRACVASLVSAVCDILSRSHHKSDASSLVVLVRLTKVDMCLVTMP